MKKLIFCLALTGCFTRPMTIEEVKKAQEYCESKGMDSQYIANGLNPGYPIQIRCVDNKNKLYYDVPRR